MALPLIAFYRFKSDKACKVPGYFAVSTAPPNIEDQNDPDLLLTKITAKLQPDLELLEKRADNLEPVQSIARTIAAMGRSQSVVDLVITIHGYNTDIVSVKDWYKKIWQYANEQIAIDNAVFLGYRWSSETIGNIPRNLLKGIQALPVLLALFLVLGLSGAIGSAVVSDDISWVFVASFFLAMLVVTLLLLRMVVYFRDNYRATNFGVPDLVELIRQLDQALQEEMPQAEKPFVRLSFIAHSMGGFVTTNAVRILSDVFAPESIGTASGAGKKPSSKIGRVFFLGRLVLASPDIPSATIVPGRANFLKSSLRRFEEAYLFSNEGDLALRIASTAANYFSFPTNQRIRGHRLGNVTVSRQVGSNQYGVVNWDSLKNITSADLAKLDLSKLLEINTLWKGVSLSTLQPQKTEDEEPIANLFTYLDCTDYFDRKYIQTRSSQANRSTPSESLTRTPRKLLCYRLDRPWLNPLVYPWLMLNWMIFRTIDVHGGYFDGEFTRATIYNLAFVGFRQYLCSLGSSSSTAGASCDNLTDLFERQFNQCCRDKQIQVVFSPERYWVNVLGAADNEAENLTQVREAILQRSLPTPLEQRLQQQLNQ